MFKEDGQLVPLGHEGYTQAEFATTEILGERYVMGFEYWDELLYRIMFRGPSMSSLDAARVEGIIEDLIEMMSGRYGEPDDEQDFSLLYQRPGHFWIMARWHLDGKTIRIGSYKRVDVREYSPLMAIECPEILAEVEAAAQEEKDAAVGDAAEDF